MHMVMACVVSSVMVGHSAVSADAEPGAPDLEAGRYIVVVREGRSASSIAARSPHVVGVSAVFNDAIDGFVAEFTEEQIEALSDDPAVAYVAEDAVLSVATTQTGLSQSGQWGLDVLDDRTFIGDQTYDYVEDGSGVDTYVFDTGIRKYTANSPVLVSPLARGTSARVPRLLLLSVVMPRDTPLQQAKTRTDTARTSLESSEARTLALRRMLESFQCKFSGRQGVVF